MLTQLYQRLVIRLMPPRLLDAMHVVYEECARSCKDRTSSPFIHPIETLAEWLQEAHQIGWEPPSPPVELDFEGLPIPVDEAKPSWFRGSDCFFEELD